MSEVKTDTLFQKSSKMDVAKDSVQSIQLQFQDLQFDVPEAKSRNPFRRKKQSIELSELDVTQEAFPSPNYKRILHPMSASFEPGTITAIMGSSGAGKTTLLNVLAGRAKGKTGGNIFANGSPIQQVSKSLRKHQAYVMQDDVLLPTQTPQEILEFAAKLRLRADIPEQEKLNRVNEVISQLNLTKCKDTRVGAPGIARGISGGERKRVSIAQEILTNPSLLFLDEPTSGLDAFTAEIIIDCLKDMAKAGRTILFTIHQPNSQIFAKFDKLILLAKGEMVYWGPAKDSPAYFGSVGYPLPEFSNPADFFMQLLHIGSDQENESHVNELISSYKKSKLKIDNEKTHPMITSDISSEKSGSVSILKQGMLIAKRNIVDVFRSPLKIRATIFQTIFLGLLIGLIYLQQSYDVSSIQNRVGSLFFIATNQIMTAIVSLVNTFPNDKIIFFRERSNHMYSTGAYFLAKMISDLPFQIIPPVIFSSITYWMIGLNPSGSVFVLHLVVLVVMANCGSSLGLLLGIIAKDSSTAFVLVPVSIIPLMVFSGFLINNDNVPKYFIWLNYISPMRWGFQAMMKNIFADLTFTCEKKIQGKCVPFNTGNDVLDFYKMTDSLDYTACVLIIVGMIVFLRILSFVILAIKARRTKANS